MIRNQVNIFCNMVTFFRAIKFGIQNAWRNFGLSTITITILVLMVLSINVVFAIGALTNQAISTVKNQVDISIFFQSDAEESQVAEVQTVLSSFPEVKEVTLQTPDEVLEAFRNRHARDEDIQYSLAELEENPLGATLIVRTQEPGQYESILRAIDVPEYDGIIEARTFDDTGEIISRIDSVTSRAKNIALAVTILFGIVAFLVVASAIRVAIFTQREEIGIQKLVGAGNWFIRAPFMVEVVLYCTVAMVISLVLLYFGITLTDPYIRSMFGAQSFSLLDVFSSNGLWLFGAEFISLILLCMISGSIAMRRFLRV